jgi:hypothetical protein
MALRGLRRLEYIGFSLTEEASGFWADVLSLDQATTTPKSSYIGGQRFVGGHLRRTEVEPARHAAAFAGPS